MGSFTPISLLITLLGFVGGAILWNSIASHSGVWARMPYQAEDVRRMLVKQMSSVVVVMALLLLLRTLLGEALSTPLGWLLTIAGVIFWGYLGALTVTALRGMRQKR
jgi:hypothetical protein